MGIYGLLAALWLLSVGLFILKSSRGGRRTGDLEGAYKTRLKGLSVVVAGPVLLVIALAFR